ncbi:transcription factor BHLH062 [Oryza brachyantha]|uniref:BHLH domain-containing protein n=1 Tax=Oryza brachyantha TaxID=4533 RepID=J3MN79_ORYBR|nr:transcription factor BHLH062 [Oryza brachyantha]XP_015695359.1 transcription factor BHLH062 [Oryza brachyantha]
MVPRDRVNAAAAADGRLVQSGIANKKCDRKAPKRIHKSEREKIKRDKQNDLFSELGNLLEPDRQNNGKACVLGETTRILKDLLSQVESLRKENSALKNESHYVALERNELHDDNSMLRSEILDLQNEIRMRMEGSPVWSHVNTGPALRVSYPTNGMFPVQHLPHLPVTTTVAFPQQQPVVIEQHYATTPRELQLFPESATSEEDSEPSQEHGISDHVTRPQARYPAPGATVPVNLFPVLPGIQDQQCSSGTTGTSSKTA